MDWKLFATTFAAVFIAELGDKTQLATLSFSTSGASRWAVFFGSALALVCTSAIAVLFGEALTKVISPKVLHKLAGALFVGIGAWVSYQAWK
jgi:putative Ca2+/H+ antiporter (TMEM165/GDT1 family)